MSSLVFEFEVVDFNPSVKFRPRHCLRLQKLPYRWDKFINLVSTEISPWLMANVGVEGEDYVIMLNVETANYRFWFKDKTKATLFKLTFGGTHVG